MSDERFTRLEDKLDALKDDVKGEIAELKAVVQTGFAVYNEQLKIHIRGTEDNRDAIKLTNVQISRVEQRLAPIEGHVLFLRQLGKLAVKIIGGLILVGGFIIAVLEYTK